jgi:hypothetical protein
MTIILNSDILDDLKMNKTIILKKKFQKNSLDYNFYINPNIGIKLYNAKVIDVSQNYIVFEYNKKNALNLFILLKNISEYILNLYKNSDSYELKTLYNLYMDKEDTFTVRCYLPKSKYKYNIYHYENNNQTNFNLPRKGALYNEVLIDIRNIWIKNNKVGFNLELKETKNLF